MKYQINNEFLTVEISRAFFAFFWKNCKNALGNGEKSKYNKKEITKVRPAHFGRREL